MSNMSAPAILLRTIELPTNARAAVLKSLAKQAWVDARIMFFLFIFVGFGLEGLIRLLWFNDLSKFQSAAIAIGCGLLGSIFMAVLHTFDLPTILRDLNAGFCNEASVYCKRAIRVRFKDSSLEGVALDCGNDVLVLVGNWWLNVNRSDIWVDPKSRKNFPARQFRIQFLPRSGKVLKVYMEGEPIFVEESASVEPLISLSFFKYSEVVHVGQDLSSITINEG